MDKERALEYWINRHNHAKDYSDIHWDAEERHEYRDYVDAMAWAIKALEQYAEAADVQPVNQWISVKDRLPEKDCLYIVCRTIYLHQIVFEARWKDSKWLSVVASNQIEYITHWMPLPEPPKGGDTE